MPDDEITYIDYELYKMIYDQKLKLENQLEKTQRNLLDLSDRLKFKDYEFGPSAAMAQQVILLRKENNKLKVERNKAVRELKSIKKKLLKLGEPPK